MDPYHHVPHDRYNAPFLTSENGAPMTSNLFPLTVGNRGPILLEDFDLVAKLATFEREKLPERVVHAQGATAKGFFEVTHDVSDFTAADFLRAPGARTPVIVRFSTVTHPRGSPETLRDPRGFAVKFYTREGNYDLVGNNLPVFFIQDAMQFPNMVRAFKSSPKLAAGGGAGTDFSRVWNFFAGLGEEGAETLHMITFLFDDLGIPQDYRHMNGFGVNTYQWINAHGRTTLVKYHWVTKQGVKSLDDPEAVTVGGKAHAHALWDLHDAINRGDFPEWTLCVQLMDVSEGETLPFDPVDVTKTWPEDRFPLRPVGRMVLNHNTEFFAENEQAAFAPGNIVPGIYFSNCLNLQGRIFSYLDAHRARLGTNFSLLPVNAPRCAFNNRKFNGAGQFGLRENDVDYWPSRSLKDAEKPAMHPYPSEVVAGQRVRKSYIKQDYYTQAGQRFRSFDGARQERFIRRLVSSLSGKTMDPEVRKVVIGWWTRVDARLGERLTKQFGM